MGIIFLFNLTLQTISGDGPLVTIHTANKNTWLTTEIHLQIKWLKVCEKEWEYSYPFSCVNRCHLLRKVRQKKVN